MQLTQEQKAILDSSGNAKIHAVAGSGKTSTLVEYARHRGENGRILYLAFNRSVRLEAQRRFEAAGLQNVRVETAHSLAWSRVVPQANYKVRISYKPWEIARILKIKPFGRDPHTSVILAGHIGRFVSLFCNQPQSKVQQISYPEWVHDRNALNFVKKFEDRIIDGTRKFLALMNSGEIEITHEFYLKKFQLSKPGLPFDIILFDEGQDASPVMLDVFLSQPQAVKLIVGDVNQQIYAWRYAVNALSNVDFKDYSLTSSFRFPQRIADLAMAALRWKIHLKNPLEVKIKGLGKKNKKAPARATVARTNLSLLRSAIDYSCFSAKKQIYFEGNLSSYTYAAEGASIWDVLSLFNGKMDLIRDPLIAEMDSFDDLREYADLSEDTELLTLIDMVDEYGKKLPFYMKKLKECHTDDSRRSHADMIFSTVHKCKGLEYNSVTLTNDFINEKKLIRLTEKKDISDEELDRLNEEINLLYVAITRSCEKITFPDTMFEEQNAGYRDLKTEQNKLSLRQEPRTKAAKEKYINAYQFWSKFDDDRLRFLVTRGTPVKKIAEEMKRKNGAISSRMKKLGIKGNIW